MKKKSYLLYFSNLLSFQRPTNHHNHIITSVTSLLVITQTQFTIHFIVSKRKNNVQKMTHITKKNKKTHITKTKNNKTKNHNTQENTQEKELI